MSKEFDIFDAALSGISLVEAGAGTGKTFNISSLYVRVILEKELLPPNILVLTFTEAATAELKSRLRKRISESIAALEGGEAEDEFLNELKVNYPAEKSGILKKALYSFDEARISTIHGFCQRLLKERSLEFGVNPEFEILSDERELLQDTVDSYWREFFKPTPDMFHSSLQYHLFEHGYDPDKLLQDFKVFRGSNPEVIEPEVTDVSKFRTLFDQFLKIRERAHQALLNEKQELEIVFEGDALNKNVYNQYKYLYLTESIKWLCSEPVSLIEYKKLKLFSSEKLIAKKDRSIPEFEFIRIIDDLRELMSGFSNLLASQLFEAFEYVSRSYEKAKSDKGLLSYDDLLKKVETGIQNKELSSSLRKELPVALIDEFQDTDPVQYSIFKSLYKGTIDTCLFMIGDPKQAIYAFRGADIHTYIKAREDADHDQVYALKNNYRSNPEMIRAVNEIFSVRPNSFRLKGLDFEDAVFPPNKNPEDNKVTCEGQEIKPLQFIELETEASQKTDYIEEICGSVASEILNLLNGTYSINQHEVSPKDIAVLVRTRKQASQIQEALRLTGVKSVLNSRESVFRSADAEELFLVLSAIADPSFEALIRAAMSTGLLGFKAADLIRMKNDSDEWENVLLQFNDLNRLWNSMGISTMLDTLIFEFEVELKLASWFDAERRITNIQHLTELLKKAERQRNLHPIGILNYMRSRIDDEDDPKDEEVIRLESDSELVQIVTMHSSKGLQYPIVFCPFLFEDVNVSDSGNKSKMFSFRKDGVEILDLGTPDEMRKVNKEFLFEEQLQERIRLTYVALTRAESACYIYLVSGNNNNSSGLAAIVNEVGEDIIQGAQELAEGSEVISFRSPESSQQKYVETDDKHKSAFRVKTFKRDDIQQFKRVTSFSALNDSVKVQDEQYLYQGFDYDALTIEDDRELKELNIFSLTKGAATGTLVHNIFESISFDKPETFQEKISEQLQIHGFEEKWFPVLKKLIEDSIAINIKDGLKLESIADNQRLVEMEFNIPVKGIRTREIVNIIRGENHPFQDQDIKGFLKGFIDLVFIYKDKFYILDYKTNHLGDSFEDYSMDIIAEEIKEAGYDLQYHIYTTCLHRYLKQNLNDYEYENHFGGVIYLFVRGVQSGKEGSGVYFDRPEFSVISTMDEYFKTGVRNG